MLVCIGDIAHVSGGEACTVRLRGDVLQPLTDTRHLCELLLFGFLRCATQDAQKSPSLKPTIPNTHARSQSKGEKQNTKSAHAQPARQDPIDPSPRKTPRKGLPFFSGGTASPSPSPNPDTASAHISPLSSLPSKSSKQGKKGNQASSHNSLIFS